MHAQPPSVGDEPAEIRTRREQDGGVIEAEPRAVSDGPNTTFLVQLEEHPIVGLVP